MKSRFWSMWQFLKPLVSAYKRWYILGIACLVLTTYTSVLVPQIARDLVGVLGHVTEQAQLEEQQQMALKMIALGFFMIIVRFCSRLFLFWPGRKIEADLKQSLFKKLLYTSEDFLHSFQKGDLVSRLSTDVDYLRALISFGILQLLNFLFLAIFIFSNMLTTQVSLTVASLSPLILMILLTKKISPKMRVFSKKIQTLQGRLSGKISELFAHAQIIYAHGVGSSLLKRCERENQSVFLANMKLIKVRYTFFPLMAVISQISQLVVLFYGGWLVIKQEIVVGDILAFNIYLALLTFPLTAIGIFVSLLQHAYSALERLQVIYQAPVEKAAPPVVVRDRSIPQEGLYIRQLRFAFPKQAPCIDIAEFSLTQGQKTGIVGKIGSGKSTLCKLIMRLHEPPPGKIFWMGRDVRSIEPQKLRQEIGYLPQTAYLFSDNILANTLFGLSLSPSKEEIERVMYSAQFTQDLARLPKGLFTEVGELGVKLSGGQKQRLALVRLLLRQPKMWIFDDAFSAIDQSIERRIFTILYSMSQMMMIITHRRETLGRCHEVKMFQPRGGSLVDARSSALKWNPAPI